MHESIKRTLTVIGALAQNEAGRYTLTREALYTHPTELKYLAGMIAGMFYRRNIKTVVAASGPSFTLAAYVGQALNEMQKSVCTAYTMETPGGLVYIPEHHRPLITDQSVLVIEDFVTDCAYALAVLAAVSKLGGRAVGFGAIAETVPHFQDVFGQVTHRHALLSSHQLGL